MISCTNTNKPFMLLCKCNGSPNVHVRDRRRKRSGKKVFFFFVKPLTAAMFHEKKSSFFPLLIRQKSAWLFFKRV